jgi:hypothetical protein
MIDCGCTNFPASLGNVTFGASVGIGTTAPAVPLEVDGDRELIRLGGQTAEFLGFLNGGTPYAYLGVGQDGTLLTGAAPNSLALRANTSLHLGSGGDGLTLTVTGGGGGQPGNVGIGTTSPGAALDVQGPASGALYALRCVAPSTGYNAGGPWDVNEFSAPNATANQANIRVLSVLAAGDWLFTVRADGNVGIGTTSPQQKLDVAGTVRCTGVLLGGDMLLSGGVKDSTGQYTRVDANGCYYAD